MTDRALADLPGAVIGLPTAAAPLAVASTPPTPGAAPAPATDPTWWRSAVIYQVYVRELRRRRWRRHRRPRRRPRAAPLSARPRRRCHLVHALVPVARSPTAATTSPTTAPSIRRSARSRRPRPSSRRRSPSGIRTIVDIVPNHVSDAAPLVPGRPWRPARAHRERARFWFRPGRGADGDEHADGLARRLRRHRHGPGPTNPDGTPGEWYLHLFTPEQPDLNWDHPDVRREHEDILRFWFDRGAAGVRIDSAALLVKDPPCRRCPADPAPGEHPTTDRDELHDIYRSWRAIADSYPGDPDPRGRGVAARCRSGSPAICVRTSSTPRSTSISWPGRGRRRAAGIDRRARSRRTRPIGAPATWVLSNHDVTRPVTRYGRDGQLLRVPREAPRDAHRPRARSPAGPRRGAARRGPAGLAVHLPGRRARPRRGRGPAGRADPGPDVPPLRRRRPGSGRLPGAAAVVG